MTTPVAANNAVAFCKYVESKLGWYDPADAVKPMWQRYRAEAAKVSRKREENPELYTWANLYMAVHFLAREKKMRTPVGVFAYVPAALEVAAEPERDLEVEIRAAVQQEMAAGDPDGWAERLNRAIGPYREQVLAEWRGQR